MNKFSDVWIGRKYRCNDTGVVVELTTENVFPRVFIAIGNGAIDLGDGFYSRRVGNIERVMDRKCCEPTQEEIDLINEGDYNCYELWGGTEPTCPKCIGEES